MDENIKKQGLEEVCKVLAVTEDAQLIGDFFECLFTPAELEDLAKRWL